MKITNLFAVGLSIGLVGAGAALGAEPNPTIVNREVGIQSMSGDYWTPERLKNAKEMDLQPAGGFLSQQEVYGALSPQLGEQPLVGKAHGPFVKISPNLTNRLFESDPSSPNSMASGVIAPNAVGTFGAPFSSSRVTTDMSYPYRTVGKLFFTIPGQGDYMCSASVIQARLIVTAGHCVHDGRSAWYGNWRFIPAYRDGVAPFGTWTWSAATVTGTWASGGGGVPNAADYAVIALADQPISGTVRRAGEVTGWLGWRTISLQKNHVNMIGYPANFDYAGKMHQVAAQSYRSIDPNCVEYGSDMQGGSSGGPWVQNFGVLSIGQTNSGLNQVVGVTSYGYVSTDPKVQGASTFDKRFSDVVSNVCSIQVGNCI